MGRKCPCEDIVLPPKPVVEQCIASSNGTAACCNDAGCVVVPVQNMVCRDSIQDAELFKWIEFAIEAVSR